MQSLRKDKEKIIYLCICLEIYFLQIIQKSIIK
jgi:hypothetical protein